MWQVSQEFHRNRRASLPRQPWEVGPLAAVFGTAPLFAQVPPQRSFAAWLQPEASMESTFAPTRQARKRKLKFMDKDEGEAPAKEDTISRKAALGKWLEVASAVGSFSGLVQKAGPELKEVLEDVFAAKSDATLRARAGSIQAFLHWCRLSSRKPWPIKEEVLYKYVTFLKFTRAPPTKATSFMTSLAFLRHYLEVEAAPDTEKSARIKGSTWRQFTRKRETTGRSPLTVPQVRLLQATVCAPGDAVERLLAGFGVLLVALRVRFADAQRAREEPVLDLASDGWGFLELPVGRTKTTTASRPQDVKASKVAVGHAQGFGGAPWARCWLDLRTSMHLDASRDGCLMRAFDAKGALLPRRLRSHEFSRWLQNFLKSKALSVSGQILGSHCGKVTALSWCAKFAVEPSARRALGYHVPNKDKMVQVYSRDYQAGPLRRLAEVEKAIDEGIFDPDATRSGRFYKVRDEAAAPLTPGLHEYKFILALKYRRLHARVPGSSRSPCGRADASDPNFSTHVEVPIETATICKNCFGKKSIDELKADS